MYKKSISNLKKIRNKHIQNYLEEHGCLAAIEDEEAYYYKKTSQFTSLLDSYFIEFICIPNKL